MEDPTRQVEAIARDRESGASEILRRAIEILAGVVSRNVGDRLRIARALCRAQPGMASVWNAALAAASDEGQPARFDQFVQRSRRAPAALTRLVGELFADADPARPLRLVTLSYSGSVRQALETLSGMRPVHVACAEGRPVLEGRRMAARLAESGALVTLFSDAAISEALGDAHAIVVGADAIASEWFTNKVGTRMLAAAAGLVGLPVYVVAARDKFCAPALAPLIRLRDAAAHEIWDAPPARVAVRNPYFERVPLDLVAAVITEGGVMPAPNVAQFCASLESAAPAELVEQLAAP